jgi:hypothetical protein
LGEHYYKRACALDSKKVAILSRNAANQNGPSISEDTLLAQKRSDLMDENIAMLQQKRPDITFVSE